MRWSLLAGLLGLAVVVAFGAIWYTPVTGTDFGWFAYAPLDDALDRVIAHSLERDAERCSHEISDRGIDSHRHH